MDFYAGAKGDTPMGGGAYVNERGFGHEIFNFRPDFDGKFRGYVRPPGALRVRNQRINIDRLGSAKDDDRIRGVTVFWAATHPSLGGTRVVGWYENANVYRGWHPSPKKRVLPNGEDAGFMVEASTARLIPSDDRTLELPRATSRQTGIGQSNVWYVPAPWARRLLRYRDRVRAGTALGKPASTPTLGRTSDTEARLRIERAAMAATIAWCKLRGLPARDGSLQRLGWDIEAGQRPALLRIEVKGSSRPIGEALLELTPNEFAMMGRHRTSFRLSVVSLAGKKPELAMFRWSGDKGAWVASGYEAKLHEVLSARVEVLSA
jgi:hypothetical protein